MKNAIFIAWHDLRFQLRQGATMVWIFIMPPVFFYFIGTVTGGMAGTMSGAAATPIVVAAKSPGFLQDQIDLRLRDNDFEPEWRDELILNGEGALPPRVLEIGDGLTEQVLLGETVTVSFDTNASALSREFEILRVQRSLYTALADIVTADARNDSDLSARDLSELNIEPRVWQLDVAAAGNRQIIPSGFEQAIPGILVMFTLLVLLTSGGSMLVIERQQGLLRRLAYAPMSRAEVVAGKWGGRMVLAALQVATAMTIGTFLFDMNWGPDLAMIAIVLGCWAAFCASAGLLLGSIANSEGQASGLGVLASNVLAALGGCWWPIEITPGWMQALQNFLPTGWAMDAMHRLISFEAGALSALPFVVTLLAGTLVVGALAVNRFRYE